MRLFLLKGALAGLALAVLVHLVEWGALVSAARGARPGWALGALALVPLNVALEAYRYHLLVVRLAPEVRYGESLRAVVGAYPLGLLTPARVGDYAGRALALPQLRAWDAAALTFAERMVTLACCLAFGLVALAHFLLTRTAVATTAWLAVLWLGAFGTAAFLLVLLHPHLARAVLETVLPFERVRPLVAFLDRLTPSDAHRLFGLSALRYAVFSTQFVLLVRALDPATSWAAIYAGVALVFFAKSALPSFTLGDLGVREGTAVYFLGAFGVAEAAALNASLGLFVVNLLLPALAGLPLTLRLRPSLPKVPSFKAWPR
ncbi:MAG TPA: lysylphosphatidylglycerol synthase transmembrane domain-containing protein [Rubricoccaceae bacterium]|nr:lysylphosphatidylglycerol synthase transmembrane domain-containing protein [Rubricoccaceae bacterium]